VFISRIPDDISRFYPESFIPSSLRFLETGLGSEQYKIELVKRFCSGGRLLEIGSSYGGFLYLAKNTGFKVASVEMDKRCCDFINEYIDVKVFNTDDPVKELEHMRFYDVVCLWQTLEHLPDPLGLLDAVYTSLRVGGILVLSTPNPDAMQAHLMGRRWPHVDAPRHLRLFPISLLSKKLQALGMVPELVTTRDAGSLRWNTYGWIHFTHSKILGNILSLLFSPVEKIEGKGSCYTMVYRKVK
jgi:SAM-dependent methyltransferase